MNLAQFLAYVKASRWALAPEYYRALVGTLEGMEAKSRHAFFDGDANRLTANNVAIVSLRGAILDDADGFAEFFGLPSHQSFAVMMRAAADDDSLSEIILDISSPGGVVAGVDTSVEAVRYARSKKPVTAVVGGYALSCGYWLASQASHIVAAPTAMVGNIGIIYEHTDISEAQKKAGVTTELLTTGEFKGIMNPTQPLTDAHRERWMLELREAYSVFIDDVAKGRGISVDAAHEQWGDAGMYTGQRALDAGLVDSVGTLQSVLDNLTKSSTSKGRKAHMDLEQLKAEHPELYASIMAAGKAEGKTEAETERGLQAASDNSPTDLENEVVRLKATTERLEREGREEKRKNIASTALETAALPKAGKTAAGLDLDASFRLHVEGLSLNAETDDKARTKVDEAIIERRALMGDKDKGDTKRRAFLPSGDTDAETHGVTAKQPTVNGARRSLGLR